MIALTRDEFCMFNNESRLNLIRKDGKLLGTRFVSDKTYSLYSIYDFLVELIFDDDDKKVLEISLVTSRNWANLYR